MSQTRDTFGEKIDAAIKDMSTKLNVYTVTLIAKLKKELTKVPEVLFWTKDAFNIKMIKARGEMEAPASLEQLFNSSKKFGIYANPTLSFDDFLTEYYSFAGYIKSNESDKDSLYLGLLFNQEIHSFPNVMQLLAASAARSTCEGIIESR